MATPLSAVAAPSRGPSPARQALDEALRDLEAARSTIYQALGQPTAQTCSAFLARSATQLQHAANNVLRAQACLQTPPGVQPLLSYRRIPFR